MSLRWPTMPPRPRVCLRWVWTVAKGPVRTGTGSERGVSLLEDPCPPFAPPPAPSHPRPLTHPHGSAFPRASAVGSHGTQPSEAGASPRLRAYKAPRSFRAQGNLSELGKLLMQGSFSVWTDHKKGHSKVKDLARFKPMQRHLFLHEKAVLFCKRREESGEGYEKAPSYSYKQSLNVSGSRSRRRAARDGGVGGGGTPASSALAPSHSLRRHDALTPSPTGGRAPVPHTTNACPRLPRSDGGRRHHGEREGRREEV